MGMWSHNLKSFSLRNFFLIETTEPGIEPSTFQVEILKLNQEVRAELPRSLTLTSGLEIIKGEN